MISGYSLEAGKSIPRWCSVRPLDLFLIMTLLTCMCTVDQPAGTGFSYTSTDRYVHTIDVVRNSRPAVSEISVLMIGPPGSHSTARVFQELLSSLP